MLMPRNVGSVGTGLYVGKRAELASACESGTIMPTRAHILNIVPVLSPIPPYSCVRANVGRLGRH